MKAVYPPAQVEPYDSSFSSTSPPATRWTKLATKAALGPAVTVGAIMMRGLGLRILGASHVGHTRDGTRGGARRWYKSRGFEVVGCNVRCEGKSRGS
jgi:hypothetical protein